MRFTLTDDRGRGHNADYGRLPKRERQMERERDEYSFIPSRQTSCEKTLDGPSLMGGVVLITILYDTCRTIALRLIAMIIGLSHLCSCQ